MKDLNYKGGDLVGSGSYGCVFNPSLNCKGKKNIENTVSKIFFGEDSKKEAMKELNINNLIKNIKGYDEWANIWDKVCIPPTYSEIIKKEPDIEKCIDENNLSENDFNNNSKMLLGKNAGLPLELLFLKLFPKSIFSNNKLFIKHFLYLMKLLKPLFIGLNEMYNHKLVHNDIKGDNIMIDDERCKFIDFGLAAKISNNLFFKQRSMSEYFSDRIYPPYPYEFIYLYANNDVLQDEREDKKYDIYRSLFSRYKLVHATIFQRKNIKEYLLGLIDKAMNGGLLKYKQSIISQLDTYSLGVMIPYKLANIANKHNKLKQFKTMITKDTAIKSFFNLFKLMCEPDCLNRIKPIDAYNRYLELDKLYISKDIPKQTIHKKTLRKRKPPRKRKSYKQKI